MDKQALVERLSELNDIESKGFFMEIQGLEMNDARKLAVLLEHSRLTNKITKLANFVTPSPGADNEDTPQLTMLLEQLSHMKNYQAVLHNRLHDVGVVIDE